jgi:hypothetical protein
MRDRHDSATCDEGKARAPSNDVVATLPTVRARFEAPVAKDTASFRNPGHE